ncbi:hypothetical protein [Clostridium paraputrificum]|uniref:hypothetical protein n=1 Tax=Clostridium paraputrificum TaxID=29363 RepID=UPI00189F215F|nr:hypothetical protein [Clostridium paraputrificum]
MDYKGWVLSIYDEYKNRYYKNKKFNNKPNGIKEIFKTMFKKENIYLTILIMIALGGSMIIYTIRIFKGDDNIFKYLVIPWGIFLIGIIPQWYKYELTLDDYEERVGILRELLKEKGLYNIGIIKELYKSTRGISFYIKSSIVPAIGIIPAIVSSIKIDSIDEVTLKYVLIILFLLIIIIVPIIYLIYIIMHSIPNSRIERSSEFNQLLKILILIDKHDLDIEKEDKNVFVKLKEILK